jgi:hypothetical protein
VRVAFFEFFPRRCRKSLWDENFGFKGVRAEGLAFTVEHLAWKRLPKSVFESIGGFEVAKNRRALLVPIALTQQPAPALPAVAGAADSTAIIEAKGGDVSAQATANGDHPMAIEVPEAMESGQLAAGVPASAAKASRKRTKSDDSVGAESTSAVVPAAIKQEPKKIKLLLPPHVIIDVENDQYIVDPPAAGYGSSDSSFVDVKPVVIVPTRLTSVVWQCLS